ncbi:MAG: hypothetical protein IT210_10340 [Armatimonadetes bacterium]|nr:hypothetical protein [Armatimonadota bacterium]
MRYSVCILITLVAGAGWGASRTKVLTPKAGAGKPKAAASVPARRAMASIVLYGQGPVRIGFKGAYGGSLLSGKILRYPQEPLLLTGPGGKAVSIPWESVKMLKFQENAFDEKAEGVVGELKTVNNTAYRFIRPRLVYNGDNQTSPGQSYDISVPRMPEGSFLIYSPSAGKVEIPAAALRSLNYAAPAGAIVRLPAESLALDIGAGQKISVPWAKVGLYERQPEAGTATVYFASDWSAYITGKLSPPIKGAFVLNIAGKAEVFEAKDVLSYQLRQAAPAGGRAHEGSGGGGGFDPSAVLLPY